MSLVVVSGGGTGIGRAIAEAFARDGRTLVIAGRRERVLADAAAGPAFVEDTGFFGAGVADERRRLLAAQTLTGRPGRPQDVAAAVPYLASPEAGHVSGQVVQVSGGALVGRG